MQLRRGLSCRLACALLCLLPVVAPASANDAPLVTDRPDITESALVVPRGSVQLEIGFGEATVETGGPDVDVTTSMSTLVRWGLSDSIELRGGFDGRIDLDAAGIDSDGNGDSSLGIKWTFRDGSDGPLAAGLIVATSLPSGDDGFGSEQAEPTLLLALAHDLSERVGLSYNAALSTSTVLDASGGKHRQGVGSASASLGVGLADRVAAFVEFAAEWPLAAGGAPTNVADAGLTFALRDRLQLDLSVGTGLSDPAEGSFYGIGLAYRWDRD